MDDVQVSHWVHTVLHVHNVRVIKRTTAMAHATSAFYMSTCHYANTAAKHLMAAHGCAIVTSAAQDLHWKNVAYNVV